MTSMLLTERMGCAVCAAGESPTTFTAASLTALPHAKRFSVAAGGPGGGAAASSPGRAKWPGAARAAGAKGAEAPARRLRAPGIAPRSPAEQDKTTQLSFEQSRGSMPFSLA
ncbi:hypothetical protein GCM10009099_00350 [Caenispirillum bisanense]